MTPSQETERIAREIDRVTFREAVSRGGAEALAGGHPLAFRRILAALDGSETSDYALAWAEAIARRQGSRVFPAAVLRPASEAHSSPFAPAVWPVLAPAGSEAWLSVFGEEEKAAKGFLDAARVRLSAEGIEVEPQLAFGSPAGELVRIASDRRADLVVLGSRGRGHLESMMLGSVADAVKNAVSASVLVAKVPPGAGVCLIPTDGSPAAQQAAAVGLRLSEALGLRPLLLHVVAPPHEELSETAARLYEEGGGAAEARIRAELRAHGARRVEVDVRFGHPARRIVDVADAQRARLIVMGSRGLSGFRSLIAGSVSNRVAHEARCAVLLVK